MKGYKVTDKNRTRVVGVACNSLNELLTKGSQKLGISEKVIASLDDGTIIDDEDYFLLVPVQTIITLYREGEEIVTGAEFILKALRSVNSSYLSAGAKAKELVLSKTAELINLLKLDGESNVLKNTKSEDPKWFEDLDTNATSKEEFMFRKSQDRIRNFLYKFQEDIRKSEVFVKDPARRKIIQDCLRFFKRQLKSDQYFGCYFDRRCAATKELKTDKVYENEEWAAFENVNSTFRNYEKLSLCNSSGKFVCQGGWKAKECKFLYDHHINPYISREARILFSTWNLDHRIERSRTIIPTFLQAVERCGKFQAVNFPYFYLLMFTTVNLKLVHVVCHDKSGHNVSCDSRFLFV